MSHRRTIMLTFTLALATLIPSIAFAQQQRDDRQDRRQRWQQRGNGGNSRSSDATTRPTTNASYGDQYGILTERNIFMRDRASRRDRGDLRNRTAGPTTPEQSFVLTGIVFEDGDFHAYFEDLTHGGIQKLIVGGSIARGQINDIELEGVEYKGANGQTAWIEIGSNLTGTRVASVSAERVNAALGAGTTVAAPGAQPAPDPNNPNLTIEERMRLRRMQEQNPGAPLPGGPSGAEGDQGAAATEESNPQQQQQLQPPPQAQQGQQGQPQPPAAGDGTSNLSIEEQMRLRRAQELGR